MGEMKMDIIKNLYRNLIDIFIDQISYYLLHSTC
ncbi:MAG: hypothetical protein Pg6B_06920 [Candidatus Azobacteroides pseudotrichonymphae]|jgi:hypothetical protein|nr:MAG: hypothetical protein Pg6B_06920 [Candidatus Azobacteroides pseudotrichonymphae]